MYRYYNTSVVSMAVKGSRGADSGPYIFNGPGTNNFDASIFKERFNTIEQVFGWEDKFRRLLLRFERISQLHYAFKTLAYTMVNLRHLLYSASVAPYVKHLRPRWKWLMAYVLTDEAYAVTITHYNREGDSPDRHWYFLGAGLTLWSAWQASTAVGIFIGAQIPANWPLSFVLTLTFIALVVPALKDRGGVSAALVAGLVGLLAFNFPYKTGLLLAALIGIITGLVRLPSLKFFNWSAM